MGVLGVSQGLIVLLKHGEVVCEKLYVMGIVEKAGIMYSIVDKMALAPKSLKHT